MELTNKKVLVFGTGISGIGAAKLLSKCQADIIVYDGNVHCDKEKIISEVPYEKLNIILGDLDQEVLESLDLVVLSPGIPTDIPLVIKMKEMKIPIIGEIELAFAFDKGDVIALTGTNGKTTTTALIGQIMQAYKDQVFVVGNIGNSYTQMTLETSVDSVSVAELSSFQLETICEFKPKISGILNLSPDHLNRHHTMDAYVEAKFQITKNQSEEDICVLNYEDSVLKSFGEKLRSKVLYFSSKRKLDIGMFLRDDKIIYKNPEDIILCSIDELKLLGVHNYENVMMASLMAIAYGVPIELIRKVITNYSGVEHRIEFVCEKKGVTFYNDSKGTNPAAAIKGIEAMVRPTILIGGGYDKDSDYREWVQSFDGKVKCLILTGETRNKIAEIAKEFNVEYMIEESFDEAVNRSIELATQGDAVLLSPACASWGQFKNYEERGDKFKEIIKTL